MATHKAPGKAHRIGISQIELADIFPTEQAAVDWFEAIYWPTDRACGHCGSVANKEVPNRKPMPYWCRDCKSYFSVRTGTALESSRLPLRKWAFAVYIYATNLKSVSSMKLHRDVKVTQKTAWFMLHRLREAFPESSIAAFTGPVEVDESYFGGKRRNMRASKRKALTGRGASGKTAVVAMKDRKSKQIRGKVAKNADRPTLQGFVMQNTEQDAKVYTDEAVAYYGLPRDTEAVKHSAGEYVRAQAHINGVESFWSMLKRAHKGTFHKLSPKHLQRYVNEFATKHNIRESDTIDQMSLIVAGLIGRRLLYRSLIADNGLDAGAR